MKKNIETRKNEIRFRTTDTIRMRNKFIAKKVLRTWKEEFKDKDSGETVSIERNEVLFEKGTLITDSVLTSIKFWQEEGSLAGKEIEVSNQRRLSFVERNQHLFPYKAIAKIEDKKCTFLMYATSVSNALTILTDYIELNFKGGFTITDIKELDYYIILVDSLTTPKKNRLETDIAYIKGDIDTDEYLESNSVDDEDRTEDDKNLKRKFYQITSRIVCHDESGEEEESGAFIVQTYSAVRANLIIEQWLRDKEEQRYQEALKNPDRTYLKRDVNSFIEESKIIPIGRFIPVEFSQAYKDEYETDDN